MKDILTLIFSKFLNMQISSIKNLIMVVVFLGFFPFLGKSQKNKDFISANIGVSIWSEKSNVDPLNSMFNMPLTFEYQKNYKKNIVSFGLQFNYTNLNIYVDSNVYTLLKDKCKPSSLTSTYYCVYYSKINSLDLNFPIYYYRNIIALKNITLFLKAGIITNFGFYTHYEDSHPLLDPIKQVLLNPGPFISKYHYWRFKYQSYDLAIGTGINYKLSKKLSLFLLGVIQYQKGFERLLFSYPYGSDKVFILLGSTFKLWGVFQ